MRVKKLTVITSAILSVFALFLVLFFVPFRKTQLFVADEYKFASNYAKELSGIPILSQQTAYTCNVVSMAIVKQYLGFQTSEQDIRSELELLNHSQGMLPNQYLEYANTLFAPLGYGVSLVNPTSQTEILNIISDSLENNLPVVIFYSAKDDWNLPYDNTHYSVVYAIDMESEMVKVSNPYGYLQELPFTDLFDGLSFTSYQDEPLIFRLGRKVGMIKSNSIFLFGKIENN